MKKVLYILTTFLFLFLVILPLLSIILDSFSFENYSKIANKRTLFLLGKSLGLAFLVSLISTIVGGFSAFYNYDLAIANSMILIIICITLLMMERLSLSDATFLSVGSKSHKTKIIELNRSKYLLFAIHLIYIFISIIIPVTILSQQTFQNGSSFFYKALNLLAPNILDSLLYSAIGAFVLILFGFVFAYMSIREKIPAIDTILLIIFAIPSTVLGIAIIKYFNTPSLNFIYSSFWIIIIAYLGKFIFISQKLIANSIKQTPVSFEESAKLMGANFFTRIQKIVLPQISNVLFSAFLISFIFCLGELGATILVYPAGTSLMSIKVYTIMANAPQSLVSAMSLIVLIITMITLTILFVGSKVFLKRRWS